MKKYKWYILVGLIALVAGFFAGRQTSEIKETTKYVKGKTVTDTITKLIPVKETLPGTIKYKYVYKTDTVPGTNVQVIDQASTIEATVKDWNTKRTYSKNLFDDNTGKLDFSADVQYNELQQFSYNYTPITKEVTKQKIRTLTPFILASYSTFNVGGVGIGLFYHNVGLSGQYQYDFDNQKKGIGIGLHIKF